MVQTKKETFLQRRRRERLEAKQQNGAVHVPEVGKESPPETTSTTETTVIKKSTTTNIKIAAALAEKAISTATTGVILRLNPNRTGGIHHIKLLALGRTGFEKLIDITSDYSVEDYPTGALVEYVKEHTNEITIGDVLNTTTSDLMNNATQLHVITPSALASYLQSNVNFDSATTFDATSLDLNITGTAVVNGEVCVVVTADSVLISTTDVSDSNA